MAELNSYINIPVKSTQAELISAYTAALESASGITPDANGVFWMDSTKKVGFKFIEYSSTSVAACLVDYEGTMTTVSAQSANCTNANQLWYNKSAAGTCFAFGIGAQTMNSKWLCFVFATDEEGVKRIFACSNSATWYECSPGEKTLSLALAYTQSASFTSFTLVPLPTGVTRKKHAELYLVLTRPSSAATSTDAALYAGGKLYKIIGFGSTYGWLAMRV